MLLRLERLWQFSTNVCFARRQIQLKAEAESISPNNQSQPINWSYVAGRKMFVLFLPISVMIVMMTIMAMMTMVMPITLIANEWSGRDEPLTRTSPPLTKALSASNK